MMRDQHLIGRMRKLKADMLAVAENLGERGNSKEWEEMLGASKILQTWIDGIAAEQKTRVKK